MAERPLTETLEVSKKIDETINISRRVLDSFGMKMPDVSLVTKDQLKKDAREFLKRTSAIASKFIDQDFPLEIVAETTEPLGIISIPPEREAGKITLHLSRVHFRTQFENNVQSPENTHIAAIGLFMGIARLTLEHAAQEVKLPWHQGLALKLIEDLKDEIESSSKPYDNHEEIVKFSTNFLVNAILRPDLNLFGQGIAIQLKANGERYGEGNATSDSKLRLKLAIFMAHTFIKEMKKLPWFRPSETWIRDLLKDFRANTEIPAERDSYLEQLLNDYLSGDLARRSYEELTKEFGTEQENVRVDIPQTENTILEEENESETEIVRPDQDIEHPEVFERNSLNGVSGQVTVDKIVALAIDKTPRTRIRKEELEDAVRVKRFAQLVNITLEKLKEISECVILTPESFNLLDGRNNKSYFADALLDPPQIFIASDVIDFLNDEDIDLKTLADFEIARSIAETAIYYSVKPVYLQAPFDGIFLQTMRSATNGEKEKARAFMTEERSQIVLKGTEIVFSTMLNDQNGNSTDKEIAVAGRKMGDEVTRFIANGIVAEILEVMASSYPENIREDILTKYKTHLDDSRKYSAFQDQINKFLRTIGLQHLDQIAHYYLRSEIPLLYSDLKILHPQLVYPD